MNDLRTVRQSKGLTVNDLASGMLRPATISTIERGLHCPRRKTRKQLESLLGSINWRKTLAAGGKDHIVRSLSTLVNEEGPGNPRERIKYCKQVLVMLEETLNN